MPHRNWRMRVEDILQSIARIHRYTDGMTFESFIADEMRVDAVVRNITIIGEAAGHIPIGIQGQYPQMPWDEMRGIRNVVTHEYFGVSLSILWQTAKQDLPPLVATLKAIRSEGCETNHGEL